MKNIFENVKQVNQQNFDIKFPPIQFSPKNQFPPIQKKTQYFNGMDHKASWNDLTSIRKCNPVIQKKNINSLFSCSPPFNLSIICHKQKKNTHFSNREKNIYKFSFKKIYKINVCTCGSFLSNNNFRLLLHKMFHNYLKTKYYWGKLPWEEYITAEKQEIYKIFETEVFNVFDNQETQL